MLLDRRREMGSRTISARQYIQDGLVQMYDGIENAGWGSHNANSAIWKDLVGNRDWQLMNGASFGDNCFITAENYSISATYDSSLVLPREKHVTQEIVFHIISKPSATTTIIFFGQTVKYDGYNMAIRILAGYPDRWNLKAGNFLDPSYIITGSPQSVVGIYTSSVEGWNTSMNSAKVNNVAKKISHSTAGIARGAVPCISYGTGQGFYGRIYAIRVYDRKLTDAELTHNFELDKKRFNLTM